ncbi:MAG: GTPase Era [Archangium gephyra]|uniref:GTPase Era n=1 Tax=Archangium gephyra TaxID=48 RepID=A0A2W5T342_9BACT|nr:MAG: GTPase Era [Archangium gephyra]
MRSGYAAFIGRPNAGKSTLLNRLVGEKVAIVSPKPQTTRTRILGVVTKPEGQIAFFDTPGIHQAKGALNKYMVDAAVSATDDCDVVLFLVETEGMKEDVEPSVSPGNRAVLERLKTIGKPVILVLTKIDTIKKHLLLPLIDLYRKEFPFIEVLPVSARHGEGLAELFEHTLKHLPEGEPIFPADTLTDQNERTLVEELIREQVLRNCHQEVPYSVGVVVEVFDESERDAPPPRAKNQKNKTPPRPENANKPKLQGLIRLHANIFVERESQKAIVIGKRGEMLKTIGTDARMAIQRLFGTHIYLSLQVKVEPRWTERADGLRKLGYTASGVKS